MTATVGLRGWAVIAAYLGRAHTHTTFGTLSDPITGSGYCDASQITRAWAYSLQHRAGENTDAVPVLSNKGPTKY